MTWSALSIAAMLISLVCTVFIFRLNVPPNRFFIFRLPLEPLSVQACMLTIVCYFVGSLADRQRAEHRLLQVANQQLTEQAQVREQLAASHERLRLARDLHDILAHTMAGLLVQLRAIQELVLTNPSAAQAELSIAEEAARLGLVDTRNAISNLRNSQVQDLGLAVALRQILTHFEQRTGIPVQFEQRGDSTQIQDHMAEALYLIAQEALRNIERHAAASQVLVTLDTEDKQHCRCRLTIQDNGVGFDLRSVSENRFGLRGIEERATMIGAQVDVHSIQRQGTTITVAL
jgi:signal transduction histidine kinase